MRCLLPRAVGNIGYTYEDGVFVKKTVSDTVLTNDNGMLLWWEETCTVAHISALALS